MAVFLHAAGYHCLTFDVRGHGANPPEALPISAGEFGLDAAAALDAVLARPEVTAGGVVGHSMGGIGAILAAAADPRTAVLVASSTPADPYRLTRQTFRLAHLPIPDPIAYPLAWLTTRVYLRPRGHVVRGQRVRGASPATAGPSCWRMATDDRRRRHAATSHDSPPRRGRTLVGAGPGPARGAPVETLVVPGGQHSWLYEFPAYRQVVAAFVAGAFDGPMNRPPRRCGRGAPPRGSPMPRPGSPRSRTPAGGFRTLAQVALPGATPTHRPPEPDPARETVTAPRTTRVWRPSPGSARSGLRRPTARAGAPRPHPACRPACRELEEPPTVGVHRVPRPGAPARAIDRRSVGRSSRGCCGGDRAGDAGPGSPRCAAVDHVRPRPGRREHDARRWELGSRERPGDRLRARPCAREMLGYPATTVASTSCRSAIRPIPRI